MHKRLITLIAILCLISSTIPALALDVLPEDANAAQEKELQDITKTEKGSEDNLITDKDSAEKTETLDITVPDNTVSKEEIKEENKDEPIEELKEEPSETEKAEEMYTNTLSSHSPNLKSINLKAQSLADGNTCAFKVDNSRNSTAGYVIFSVEDYKGSCAEKGVDYDLSGTAKMTELSRSSKLAKVAYYVDEVKGWYDNYRDRPSIMDEAGVGSRFRAGLLAEDLLQCANQGTDKWYSKAVGQSYPPKYAKYVCDLCDDIVAGGPAPVGFTIYKGVPTNNSQEFVVWKYEPTVSLKIKKNISNAAIAKDNSLYSVTGTEFALYKKETDAAAGKNAIATFTIGDNGQSQAKDIEPGTYYLVETKAGPGLMIPVDLSSSNSGKAVTINKSTSTINI